MPLGARGLREWRQWLVVLMRPNSDMSTAQFLTHIVLTFKVQRCVVSVFVVFTYSQMLMSATIDATTVTMAAPTPLVALTAAARKGLSS